VSHGRSPWLALTALIFSVTLAACGSSSGGSPSSAAATPSPSTAVATPSATTVAPPSQTTQAAVSCPTAAIVGSALGITVSSPVAVAGGGGTSLPAGATGVACEYPGIALNVIIELISNISPSSIDLFSSKFPVPYASVAGVGDQARSFSQALNGGKNNEGVVATKGSKLVSITATATPASLAQLEALVTQLL
jgi:hypothetical protein